MSYHRQGLVWLVIALAGNPTLAEAELFRDAANHFQVDLPEGWRPLTDEELARFNTTTKNTRYDGAFREDGKFFGSAPYILYVAHHLAYVCASYEDIEK